MFEKIKGKDHFQKGILFNNAIKASHQVQPLAKVSASKVQVSLVKFVSKEAQKVDIVAAIFNSEAKFSWRPRIFFSKWHDNTATLGYGCSWVVLFLAKHAPNSKTHDSEDSEVDNPLAHFFDLMKDAKSIAGFFATSFESDGMTSYKHVLTAIDGLTIAATEVEFELLSGQNFSG